MCRSGSSSDSSRHGDISQKGKGKGKSFSRSSGNVSSSKFRKTEVDLLQHVAEQSSLGVEIGLENRRLIRILFAQGSVAALAPKNQALVDAANYVEDPTKPAEAHVQRWGLLHLGLGKESHLSSDEQAAHLAYAKKVSTLNELLGEVQMCTCKPTRNDDQIFLVQVKVSEALKPQLQMLLQSLVKLGATLHFDPAPRSALERRGAESLARGRQLFR